MTNKVPSTDEGETMNKGGMTGLTSPSGSGSGSMFGKLKAKPIKTSTANRGMTRRKGIPKRSMGFSYKK